MYAGLLVGFILKYYNGVILRRASLWVVYLEGGRICSMSDSWKL